MTVIRYVTIRCSVLVLIVSRLDPEDALASGATISRFEHATTSRDVYRASQAMVEQFIVGYATPSEALVIDLSIIRKMKPTGNSNWPFIMVTTAASVIYPYSCSMDFTVH